MTHAFPSFANSPPTASDRAAKVKPGLVVINTTNPYDNAAVNGTGIAYPPSNVALDHLRQAKRRITGPSELC